MNKQERDVVVTPRMEEILKARDAKTLASLIAPGGVEKYVHKSCTPIFTFITMNEGQRAYILSLPSEEATEKSKMVQEDMGYVCYIDAQDEVGSPCRTLVIGEGVGRALFDRIVIELRRQFVNLPLYTQAWLRIKTLLNKMRM